MEEVFIYVKDFQYLDKIESERFYGHPKQGKVYRAFLENGIYRMPLESSDGSAGLAFKNLEGEDEDRNFSDDSYNKWNYSMVVVDEKNIGDYDISLEDLEIISKEWIGESKIGEEITIDQAIKEIEEMDIDELEEKIKYPPLIYEEMSSALNNIMVKDHEIFEALVEVVKALSNDLDKNKNDDLVSYIVKNIKMIKTLNKGK